MDRWVMCICQNMIHLKIIACLHALWYDNEIYLALNNYQCWKTACSVHNTVVTQYFWCCRKDEFIIGCQTSLGALKHINIGHDNRGENAGWFLEEVEVEDLTEDCLYQFPCNRWLAVNEDDGAISRDLTAGTGPAPGGRLPTSGVLVYAMQCVLWIL